MKTFLAVILFSCAAFSQSDPEAAIAKARSACGPDDVRFDVETTNVSRLAATPEPGKALVYVIGQELAHGHGDILARVGVDGAWAGALRTGSYISFSVEPG